MPPTTDLIILFHGIGASGAQMMPLATTWKTSLPTTRFATPDAPFHKAVGPGRVWFQVDGNQLRPDRLAEIRDAFDRTIDQIIKREGYEEALDRLAFVGVSQGAIVALDAVASGRWKVGALIGYSGLLPPVPVSSESSGTPVLLVHGQNDRTIPPFASTLAASQLQTAGFKVDLKIEPGVGHTISVTSARLGLDFLRTHLG
ncbi:alpha/beta hydrolase [Aliirhizobium terrae]|uniref:alpha/beta hydrolase n=1 Tax=Terrirhizobium terrae TaxID=2926709 RepID=UPI00336A2676